MRYFLLLMVLCCGLQAQQKGGWDSTRYQKFRRNLIIGAFQSYRNFDNNFQPQTKNDTGTIGSNYMAESNLVSGLEFCYDKFSLSVGLKSTPQKNSTGKGNTQTFCMNLNIGGNIWFAENSLRSFRGFYDANTPLYDSTFKETGNYFYQPNMTNFLFRSKFLFFTNHRRYSFRSNYVCNYRQLKTGGSWILSVNTNYNYMHNDSSFFPLAVRNAYMDYGQMNGLRSFGFSTNAGGAFTLVIWRAFFVHVMFIVGPENQWRTYDFTNKSSRSLSYLSISGDVRGSFGLNFRRAYILWTSQNDFVFYNNAAMQLQNKSLGGSFMFGWRLTSHTPAFYEKFQKSKLYLAI
jgi:hypothetical protein